MIKEFFLLINLIIIIFFFCGCGKNETSSGIVGTATGAAIGSIISNDKNKEEGTLMGAVIGNLIGREIGKIEDAIEEQEQHNTKSEKFKDYRKWCINCKKMCRLINACNCPYCGCDLITEKYCRFCNRTFKPYSNYRYCPYCIHKVLLSYH